jgi:hypothetical protein
MKGMPPLFLPKSIAILLTILTLGGLLSLIVVVARRHPASSATSAPTGLSWHQLLVLTAPFTIANILILIPRAATYGLTERYLLGVLVMALPCLTG